MSRVSRFPAAGRVFGLALAAALAAGCSVFSSQLQLRPEGQRGFVVDTRGQIAQSQQVSVTFNRGERNFVSEQPASTVVLSPGGAWESMAHPLVVLMVQNLGNSRINVGEASVDVFLNGGSMAVYSYEDWRKKTQSAATWAAVAGVLAAVDLYDDASTASEVFLADLALISGLGVAEAIEEGFEGVAGNYFRQHTLSRGEWYGGALHLSRLRGFESGSRIDVVVRVGGDRHHFPLIAY